jgi:hypothetical protein
MLYLDASALVKRYVAAEGSEALIAAMGGPRVGRSAASATWRWREPWDWPPGSLR